MAKNFPSNRVGNLAGPALGGDLSGKASIGTSTLGSEGLFGGGGIGIKTPAFDFSNGTLARTGGFLDSSGRILSDLEGNRGRFSEGFTAFTASRLQDVENARARTTGNLRSQLGRRGILGASFAQDAITRTELDFVREADRVRAEAQVAEAQLDLENLKVQQQANQASVANQLAELNIASNISLGINQAIVERDRIAASLEIARIQAAASRSGGGGGSTRQGITSLSGFTLGGGGSGGFQGSTGTTATSGSIIGFDDNFNIASGINPNSKAAGGFSPAFTIGADGVRV